MTVSSVNQQQSALPAAPAAAKESKQSFSSLLATASGADRQLTGRGDADFVSGQIGLNLGSDGRPKTVAFFDKAGGKLTTSFFEPESLLVQLERFGIPRSDLVGLADQLDAAAVPYKPYALFGGTGSDAGIDLRDLASGGLGTAYDWTKDANVAQKGEYAAAQLAQSKAVAERMGLKANPEVTTGGGLKISNLAPQIDGEGVPRNYAVTNGGWAAWYRTAEEAKAAAAASQAALLDLTQSVSAASTIEQEQTDFTRALRKLI